MAGNCWVKCCYRGIDHSMFIGQSKLGALVDSGFQRLERTVAARRRLPPPDSQRGPPHLGQCGCESGARPGRWPWHRSPAARRCVGKPSWCNMPSGALRNRAANQLWKVRTCTGRPASQQRLVQAAQALASCSALGDRPADATQLQLAAQGGVIGPRDSSRSQS